MRINKKYLFYTPLIPLLLLFIIRLFNTTQIDDVSPGIPCEETLLEHTDEYYIIPSFEGKPISENKEWCNNIKSYNKTLQLHGIHHTYEEFNGNITQEELEEGITIFESCFGYQPEKFKPPQMAINKENSQLIKNRMILITPLNQLIHKTYHCNDTGIMKNWLVRII